ncbi:hypothetical protein HDG32_005341 [Paraburkholderia sp. CI2]|nr:hypothetical protein [Paraburkholderia sp. CI2]MBB5469194.1 hypothetical protein [Paraburkholderia sp. CI2]
MRRKKDKKVMPLWAIWLITVIAVIAWCSVNSGDDQAQPKAGQIDHRT